MKQIRYEEINDKIMAELTDEDIRAWFDGEMTDHVESIVKKYGFQELQIWGSRDGREPLSVVVVK